MKILTPINNPKEVKRIIEAGADEIYCGLLPCNWTDKYTNIASPNRREWHAANLTSLDELERVVNVSHDKHVPVYLTLNAFYTEEQYPFIYEQIEKAKKFGVDALIVADVGLLLMLKKEHIDLEIHISTGGTTFNSETARFYEELGASRIVLPRHLQIQEIEQIVKDCPALKFEVFILNSGCKNIDGYCTFHHGVKEVLHREAWNIPKRLNLDRYFLNMIRYLPEKIGHRIKGDIFGIDSACLLNYKVSFDSDVKNSDEKEGLAIMENIASSFNLLSGADTCGVCRLSELKEIGVYGVKIVGRNYSTGKKLKDVKFIKTVLRSIEDRDFKKDKFFRYVRKTFRNIYKMNCRKLCYYPDGM